MIIIGMYMNKIKSYWLRLALVVLIFAIAIFTMIYGDYGFKNNGFTGSDLRLMIIVFISLGLRRIALHYMEKTNSRSTQIDVSNNEPTDSANRNTPSSDSNN